MQTAQAEIHSNHTVNLDDRRQNRRHIFSAYEVGKIAITVFEINRLTDNRISLLKENTSTIEAYDLYNSFPELDFIPVENNAGKVTGYIRRESFMAALSQNRFSRELILRPEIQINSVMEKRVVVLDAFTTLPEASRLLMSRDDSIRFDPFVVTLEGEYFGFSTVRRVLDGLNFYMRQDVDACTEAQETMLHASSKRIQHSPGKALSSSLVQALNGPGGDFTAEIQLNEDLTLYMLFDVCGKGIKASNMVIALGSALQTWYYMEGRFIQKGSKLSLTGLMEKLNNITADITPGDMYATGIAVLVNTENMTMQITDYGHGYIWLKRNQKVYSLHHSNAAETTGGRIPFFGINHDFSIKSVHYKIHPGDQILTCSDGIIEAFNPSKEEYQDERIRRVLLESESESPEALIQSVITDWRQFRENSRITDDYSLLSVFIK